MAIPNAEHLFEQAERLLTPIGPGRPRQVDLRRAISTAYYAVFHATLAAAADQFAGRAQRSLPQYGLAYRSVEHRGLRELCLEVQKPTSSLRYRRYEPANGFGPHIVAFAKAVVELQETRHAADYDPLALLSRSVAHLAIETGRAAVRRFGQSDDGQRFAFLGLLMFPPRA